MDSVNFGPKLTAAMTVIEFSRLAARSCFKMVKFGELVASVGPILPSPVRLFARIGGQTSGYLQQMLVEYQAKLWSQLGPSFAKVGESPVGQFRPHSGQVRPKAGVTPVGSRPKPADVGHNWQSVGRSAVGTEAALERRHVGGVWAARGLQVGGTPSAPAGNAFNNGPITSYAQYRPTWGARALAHAPRRQAASGAHRADPVAVCARDLGVACVARTSHGPTWLPSLPHDVERAARAPHARWG